MSPQCDSDFYASLDLGRLTEALNEAEEAFRLSGLEPFVRYADTVANTRGQLRSGGKPFTRDALELRIMELQAAKAFFVKHKQG